MKDLQIDLVCEGWYSGYTYGRAEAWRLAGMEGTPPETDDDDDEGEGLPLPPDEAPAIERFLKMSRELTRILETLVLEQWKAFTLVCREGLGLEPETVLEVCMAPALETVQQALGEMQGIQADPAKVESQRDLLGRLWRKLVGLETD